MPLIHTLKFILNHPLNQGNKMGAIWRYLRWQIGSRLLPGPVLVPYVENIGLLARRGMTGATGNIYCGLHELEDMALVLHALRPNDLFVDIGANIGSYSLLGGQVPTSWPLSQSLQPLLGCRGISQSTISGLA